MAGKPKIKLFQYDVNCKYLKSFDSLTDVRSHYFNDAKYPLFVDSQKEIEKLPDSTIICKYRIGRDNLLKLLNRINNPFIIKDDRTNNNEIEILNIDKVVIATFYNVSIAAKMLGICSSNIHSMIKHSMNSAPKNKLGIYIRYKKV